MWTTFSISETIKSHCSMRWTLARLELRDVLDVADSEWFLVHDADCIISFAQFTLLALDYVDRRNQG
jgi:hypothetical protein